MNEEQEEGITNISVSIECSHCQKKYEIVCSEEEDLVEISNCVFCNGDISGQGILENKDLEEEEYIIDEDIDDI